MDSNGSAGWWGLLGGFCALVSPVVGFTWIVQTATMSLTRHAWNRFAIAILTSTVVLAPWNIRNCLVFGRFIPVKSNVAYELYQSQCLLPDGVLQGAGFVRHPYRAVNPEGREYIDLGETAFLDRKWEQFRQTVQADPLDFLRRMGNRFLAATLWYKPGEMAAESGRTWIVVLTRLVHALPVLAFLILVFTQRWRPLGLDERFVMATYVLCLFPYIVISYWERYSASLLPLKCLLILWAAERLIGIWQSQDVWQTTKTMAAIVPLLNVNW
jgi:hypothetical protein